MILIIQSPMFFFLLPPQSRAEQLPQAAAPAAAGAQASGAQQGRGRHDGAVEPIDLTGGDSDEEAPRPAKRHHAALPPSGAAWEQRIGLPFSDSVSGPWYAPLASPAGALWKLVVTSNNMRDMWSAAHGLASSANNAPKPHITVGFWTDRAQGVTITREAEAAMSASLASFQGCKFVIVQSCEGASAGITSPQSALVRCRQALVKAARENGTLLRFHSTDGGLDAIRNCHVTAGLRRAQPLRPDRDASSPEEAAWLRGLPSPCGWVLPLDLELKASPAPLAANEALHCALLWLEDTNQTAAAVAKADFAITAANAKKVKDIGPVRAAYILRALELLEQHFPGRLAIAPQCG